MKKIFFFIVHKIINTIIHIRHDISFDMSEIDLSKGPYVFLGNHVNNWDPFFLNAPIKSPISFVASERFFKTWPIGHLLNYFDAVPKMKFKSDLKTIRTLLKKKKKGLHIGIYPEGKRSWDGSTDDILYSTAKLLKMLKMPVVAVIVTGGELTSPRWSDRDRHGKIRLEYKHILSVDQVIKNSVDDIHQIISKGLSHDEASVQKVNMNRYRGKKMAEHLERLIFTCSDCHSVDRMESKNDQFWCNACGYRVKYNHFGQFELIEGKKLLYENTRDWNLMQLNLLEENIDELIENNSFKKMANVILYNKDRKEVHSEIREINLSTEGILMDDWVAFNRLTGINIQSNDKIEFFIDDKYLYRIIFLDTKESVYKWQNAISILIKGD